MIDILLAPVPKDGTVPNGWMKPRMDTMAIDIGSDALVSLARKQVCAGCIFSTTQGGPCGELNEVSGVLEGVVRLSANPGVFVSGLGFSDWARRLPPKAKKRARMLCSNPQTVQI